VTLNKPKDKFPVVVLALCVVLAVALTGITFSFYSNNLQNQIDDLKSARLVNVSLNYTDTLQGAIHVTGYVYNVGGRTAYSSIARVNFYNNGVLSEVSQIYLPDIFPATSSYVDKNVTYSGSSPSDVTFTLECTQSWQIPVM
jgi:hypothetical protein